MHIPFSVWGAVPQTPCCVYPPSPNKILYDTLEDQRDEGWWPSIPVPSCDVTCVLLMWLAVPTVSKLKYFRIQVQSYYIVYFYVLY